MANEFKVKNGIKFPDNTIQTTAATGGGSGTVTSVGGTGTVSGLTLTGTVTSSGNLTLGGTLSVAATNFASQTANTVLASPNGSAGVPTFRGLSLEDVPDAWTKRSVRVATTANITLSGTQTIDGVAVVAGDRILVKNQATASQNGIYVVAAGAWSRSLDADSASELAGALVNVDSGTTNAGKLFDTDFKSTDTIGTTAVPWYQLVDTSTIGTTVQAWDQDLDAIAALSGTTGLLRKTAANTWSLDTTAYSTTTGTVTGVTGTAPIVSSGGTAPAISISAATTSAAGSMSSADKTKLDGIASGATNVTNTNQLTNGAGFITSSGTAANVSGTVAVANGGTGLTAIAARSIPLANSANTYTTVTPAAGQSIRINAGNTAWEAYTPGTGTVTGVTGTAPIVSSGGTAPSISISAATTSAAGSMSSADKTKLDGIAAGAQVNVATNLAQGTRTTTSVPITSSTGTSATLSEASNSAAGVMSAADKTKLNGIAAGAQVNVATDLAQGTRTVNSVPITSSTGANATLLAASTTLAGVMSSADKTKLDGIASGATNVTNTNQLTNGAGFITSSGTAANVSGTVAVANGGTGLTAIAARSIPLANSANTYTTVTPAAGQSIRINAGNTAWEAYTPGGTGTVTSVGGTGTVSGLTLTGTVTSTGNLTLGGTLAVAASNFASQTANRVLAAPDGTAGVPTFRTITVGDLPTITVAKGGTALTSIAARSILVANSANTYTTVTPAAGQSIRINAGNTAWEAYTPGGTGTVTSVSGTGSTSGLSLSGTVTTSGSLTLSGTVNAVNGYKCFGGSGSTDGSGNLTVTFPSAFSSSTVLGVSAIATSGAVVVVTAISTSSVTFQTQSNTTSSPAGGTGMRWVAVGT
jgi:hypothetical protein